MPRRISKRKKRLYTAIIIGSFFLLTLFIWGIYSKDRNELYVPGDSIEGLTSELDRELPEGYPQIAFTDVTKEAGINFQHFGAVRTTQLPEDMGSGVCWGDYDNDGWEDIFISNFSGVYDKPKNESFEATAHSQLYHNNQDGTFTEVSRQAGVDLVAYANGCTWLDFNNDGYLDLFVTTCGENYLYKNNSDGSFTDVSGSAGIRGFEGFWTGLAITDYNLDGLLDIYICGYVDYQPSNSADVSLQYNAEVPASINPSSFKPVRNLFFHNNGDGTFKEIAENAGISNESGRSLEAAWCDFDDDGWPDLYVANDVSDNALYRNNGNGTFQDVSYNSFVADYRGAMGIGIGDWDNDQDFDMIITHWMAQENALYVNLHSQLSTEGLATDNQIKFMDQADRFGLGQIALPYIGFSTFFFDFDNDGRQDIFVANGSTFQKRDNQNELVPMRDQLFWNKGMEDGFFDVSTESGTYFKAHEMVGRGAAYADYDKDGDLDVIVVNNGASARLLRNDGGNKKNWLQVLLKQRYSNVFSIGAKIRLVTGDKTQIRQIGNQGPYLSQVSLVEHFGLGNDMVIDTLEVKWPDGNKQIFTYIKANQELKLLNENQKLP